MPNFRSSSLVVSSASRDSIYSRPHYTQERGPSSFWTSYYIYFLQNISKKMRGQRVVLRRDTDASTMTLVLLAAVVVVVVVLGAFEDDEEGPPQ